MTTMTKTTDAFTINADGSVTLPAGTYIVGDPCYSITADPAWDNWLGDFTAVGEKVKVGNVIGDGYGFPAVGVHTAYGDGSYYSNEGSEFLVDAGMIGLVPKEYARDFGEDEGHSTYEVTFDEPVVCSYRPDEGTIVLGHIEIKTDPKVEYTCDDCGDEIDFIGMCSTCEQQDSECLDCGDEIESGSQRCDDCQTTFNYDGKFDL